jgi:hypothetical protein
MQTLIYGGKLIVAIAAAWAIGASLYIFFAPITVVSTPSKLFRDSTVVVETFTRELSWFEAQGLWGVFVLLMFAGLFLLAARLAWRSQYTALTILSLIAIAMSIIAGFSIGGIYLPAALGLLAGALILLSSKLLGSR